MNYLPVSVNSSIVFAKSNLNQVICSHFWEEAYRLLDTDDMFYGTHSVVMCCSQGKYLNYNPDGTSPHTCTSCARGEYLNESPYTQGTSCKSCTPGFFQENFGSSECEPCPSGFHQHVESRAYCLPCIPGKYQDKPGQSNCTHCGKGQYQPKVSSMKKSDCINCGAGKFSNADHTACKPCQEGKFGGGGSGQWNATAACHDCPAGTYSSVLGIRIEMECTACRPGQYSSILGLRTNNCTCCPSGWYQPKAGCSSCLEIDAGYEALTREACNMAQVPCSPGKYSNGSGKCLRCPPGFFQNATGAKECFHCKRGQSADNEGSTKCTLCGVGHYSSLNGSKCAACPEGFFQNIPGASICKRVSDGSISLEGRAAVVKVPQGSYIKCSTGDNRVCEFKPCPAGRYGYNTPQESPCKKCPAGQSSFESSTRCFFCAKGTFSSEAGDECQDCPAGYFQPNDLAESLACELCPRGYIQTNVGESSCVNLNWVQPDDCGNNEYLNNTDPDPINWKCLSCPKGGSCIAGKSTWTTITPMFGWWKVPESERLDRWKEVFTECLYPPACPGGANPSLENRFVDEHGMDLAKLTSHNQSRVCSTELGFQNTSRLCHACKQGYRRNRLYECAKCPERGATFGLLILAVIVVCVLIAYVVSSRLKKRNHKHLHQSIKKIMINYLHVMSLARWFPLRWPGTLATLFEVQGAVSTLGDHIFTVDCIDDELTAAEIFYLKQVINAIMPVFLALMSLVGWYTYGFYSGKGFFTKRSHVIEKTPKDKCILTCNTVLFLMYPSLCHHALSIFNCRQVGKKQYLYAALEEQCYVGRHLDMLLSLGLPQLVIYVIGLPISLLLFLCHSNSTFQSDRSMSETDEGIRGVFLNPIAATRWGLFFFRWVNHGVFFVFSQIL